MDPKKISSFATLLRDKGDKILNSGHKLTLSGSLLRALNDSFILILDDENESNSRNFQVVKNNNSKSDAILDLQFIHDFVQKISYLNLTTFPNDDPFFIADITKFRNLHTLEIQRIPLTQITGLQQIRAQLQEIICVKKCINSVKDIISDCGGDKSNGFVWNELKIADFSCNCLISIDDSLEFTPWLQNLNLSHNQIVSVDAIKWLPHLKVLDLSYNKLTHIPPFNLEASRRLKVLIISNNFIESLTGISRLEALNELDLSGNCLLDHSYILSISSLSALSHLCLHDNPLACFPKHREATAKCLHKNTSLQKFLLDFEPLSKYEKTLTGHTKSHFSIFASRNSLHSHSSSGQRTPTISTSNVTPCGSVSSVNTLLDCKEMQLREEVSNTIGIQQKKIKVRRAIIVEIGDHVDKKIIEKEIVTPIDEKNMEHLETKKEIEKLRHQFGDAWLKSEAANKVQNIIGGVPNNRSTVSGEHMIHEILQFNDDIETKEMVFERKMDSIPITSSKTIDVISSTPIDNGTKFFTNTASPVQLKSPSKSTDTEYKSANDETVEKIDSIYQSVEESETSVDDIYRNAVVKPEVSDTEDNEISYIVKIEPSQEEVFLILSDVSIREKDISSGATKTKWTLNMLESCERNKSNIITINFDTIKKEKKTRTYQLERALCHSMEIYLRDILSKRPLSEMNQTLFRCAQCCAQFSRENNNKNPNIDIICPHCQSTYVIEIKETKETTSPQTSEKRNELLIPSALESLKKSASHSSIAPTTDHAWRSSSYKNKLRSAGSLNESSSCSKISNSESSFDSNQSVAGSSNNERDRDPDFIYGKNGMESDIEILSNPSQSSIEVLDRKQSEERKISQIPTLDTIIDDNNIINNSSLPNNNLITTMATIPTTTDNQYSTIATTTNDIIIIEKDEHKINTNIDNSNNNNNNINNNKDNDKDKDKDVDKKNHLGVLNLTESSSSGSVTDSICTAYEQNHGIPLKLDEKIIEKLPIKSDSVLSSMLGGLFQSTNLLMSKSQKIKTDDILVAFEPFKYNYNDFLNVDHRLKLYLYQNIFEDENEKLKLLAKGRLLEENNIDELFNGFDGLFIMTTTKCYIFKITELESHDDPSKWLKRHLAVTVDRLEYARVLPWKIGVEFMIKGIGSINLLLQDISRTDSLLLYFADNSLPDTCSMDYQISENLSQKLLKITNDKQIKMFCLLRSCDVTNETTVTFNLTSLIVTETNLFIGINLKWLNSHNNSQYDIHIKEEMNNLVEFEKINNLSFLLTFLDEIADKCELWKLTFETELSADSTLNVIGQFWEKIFGVPLLHN